MGNCFSKIHVADSSREIGKLHFFDSANRVDEFFLDAPTTRFIRRDLADDITELE